MAAEKDLSKEELIALNTQLTKRAEDAEKGRDEALQLVEELTQQLANADAAAAASDVHVVSHEGEQYRVLTPKIQHAGQVYAAQELANHPLVVAELVADGEGPLRKIEKPAAAAKPAADAGRTPAKTKK